MVGLVLQDRSRPIELLGQQEPCEFVGQSHWRKRKSPFGFSQDTLSQAECSSNDECDLLDGAEALLLKEGRKSSRSPGFPLSGQGYPLPFPL